MMLPFRAPMMMCTAIHLGVDDGVCNRQARMPRPRRHADGRLASAPGESGAPVDQSGVVSMNATVYRTVRV